MERKPLFILQTPDKQNFTIRTSRDPYGVATRYDMMCGVDMDDLLLKIIGKEYSRVKFKEMIGAGVTPSQRRLTLRPSAEENFFEMLKKYKCKQLEPMYVSEKLQGKVGGISDENVFRMTLPSHDGSGVKRKYSFRFDVAPNSISSDVAGGAPVVVYNASGEKFNYLDSKGTGVTFSKTVEDNGNGLWKSDGRQETKISKVIKSLFTIETVEISSDENTRSVINFDVLFRRDPQYVITTLGDFFPIFEKGYARLFELLAEEMKPKDYKILVSSNIDEVYGLPTGTRKVGTLGSSCMKSEYRNKYDCASSSKFYDKIAPFGVKIAYAKEKGKLIGRALLWENVTDMKNNERFKFVDRVYGAEDFISAMKEWAYQNGYWHKVQQSFSDSTLRNKAGEKKEYYVSDPIKLSKYQIDRMVPYFDTMNYIRVLSESKSYAKFIMGTYQHDGATKVQHTTNPRIVKKCVICGKLLLITAVKSAKRTPYSSTPDVCECCVVRYKRERYIKSDQDVTLSFNGRGEMVVPESWLEYVAKVEVGGETILFDVTDERGIKEFFSQGQFRYLKHEPEPEVVSQFNEGGDWAEDGNGWLLGDPQQNTGQADGG
jgi:hypothetical protein